MTNVVMSASITVNVPVEITTRRTRFSTGPRDEDFRDKYMYTVYLCGREIASLPEHEGKRTAQAAINAGKTAARAYAAQNRAVFFK